MLTGLPAGTLGGMASPGATLAGDPDEPAAPHADPASRRLLRELRGTGAAREQALAQVHALLLRAARFEVARRARSLPHLRGGDMDDLATQAADDAMVSVLAHLDDYRGDSRFTTWAYKFALLEAAVKLRRRAWQGREIPTAEAGELELRPAGGPSPHEALEQRELITAVRSGIETALTAHQRAVFVALALNGVPIDVMAERLGTTRGALYKTLHDARRKLRDELARRGLAVTDTKDRA